MTVVTCMPAAIIAHNDGFTGIGNKIVAPGVITNDYAPGYAIRKKAIRDGSGRDAVLFVADIALPDKKKKPACPLCAAFRSLS